MTENQIPRLYDKLTALTPISFHRFFIFLFFLIIYLHNASRQAPPGPHSRGKTNRTKAKREKASLSLRVN